MMISQSSAGEKNGIKIFFQRNLSENQILSCFGSELLNEITLVIQMRMKKAVKTKVIENQLHFSCTKIILTV